MWPHYGGQSPPHGGQSPSWIPGPAKHAPPQTCILPPTVPGPTLFSLSGAASLAPPLGVSAGRSLQVLSMAVCEPPWGCLCLPPSYQFRLPGPRGGQFNPHVGDGRTEPPRRPLTLQGAWVESGPQEGLWVWPGGWEAGVGGPCEEWVQLGRNGLSLLSQEGHGGAMGRAARRHLKGKLATSV